MYGFGTRSQTATASRTTVQTATYAPSRHHTQSWDRFYGPGRTSGGTQVVTRTVTETRPVQVQTTTQTETQTQVRATAENRRAEARPSLLKRLVQKLREKGKRLREKVKSETKSGQKKQAEKEKQPQQRSRKQRVVTIRDLNPVSTEPSEKSRNNPTAKGSKRASAVKRRRITTIHDVNSGESFVSSTEASGALGPSRSEGRPTRVTTIHDIVPGTPNQGADGPPDEVAAGTAPRPNGQRGGRRGILARLVLLKPSPAPDPGDSDGGAVAMGRSRRRRAEKPAPDAATAAASEATNVKRRKGQLLRGICCCCF